MQILMPGSCLDPRLRGDEREGTRGGGGVVLLIPCPYCGPRPELEFRYGGHAHIVRDPSVGDDAAWAAFLFWRDNPKGIMAERWRHVSGCGRFFNALRDTTTDHFIATYPTGAAPPAAESR